MPMTFPSYSDFCKGRFETFPVHKYSETKEKLFDLVAPVVVCLQADLRYEKQAKPAIRELAKMALTDPTLEANLFNRAVSNGYPLELIARGKLGKEDWKGIFDAMNWDAPEVYNTLLAEIAEESLLKAGYEFEVDAYGAYGYTNGEESPFNGDSQGYFAFYTNAAGVQERAADACACPSPR